MEETKRTGIVVSSENKYTSLKKKNEPLLVRSFTFGVSKSEILVYMIQFHEAVNLFISLTFNDFQNSFIGFFNQIALIMTKSHLSLFLLS